MSSRDPYQQIERSCMFDGTKKNFIRIYGQNQKNTSNFNLGWEGPCHTNQDGKVANKVGCGYSSYIPQYSVQTYRNTLASNAQRNLIENPMNQQNDKKNELIIQVTSSLKNETNEQIKQLIQKQRLENQKYLKY